MDQDSNATPRHGDKRNRRWIRDAHTETEAIHAVSGEKLGTFAVGSSRTVDERWCATCGEWIDTSKIGFLEISCGCPTCKTRW
ncbi:hypothetical protein A9R05_42130 (plasmid) [Burkholderia sp. KK1]|uniref:hypothetical protein n=1 Tax=Burkholderia sp. M701 TaxID=326454 RepID=UPI000979B6E3|nr:hypothetical protein [Burkholderia sp. M701]AQH05623.1 hypothetical protein A9R05_42130 [Burkholderia sp. KK1]